MLAWELKFYVLHLNTALFFTILEIFDSSAFGSGNMMYPFADNSTAMLGLQRPPSNNMQSFLG